MLYPNSLWIVRFLFPHLTPINLLAHTLKEVEMAVKCLSNVKSTGIDEIPIELFKATLKL